MVYRRFAGIMLCLLALGFVLVTMLWPLSVSQSVEVTTLDGLPGTIQVTIPKRAWRSDWSALTLELATSEMQSYNSPLTIRAELKTLGVADVQPQGSVSSVIDAGESAHFTWRLRSAEAGRVNGTIWLYVSENGKDEQLVFGREFSFDSMNYGFVPPSLARPLAALCFVTGFFLVLKRKKLKD